MKSERLVKSSNAFLTAFGKITGLAGRLILLFHAIENPFNPVVDAGIVERVIKIVRSFVIPTYRHVFDNEGSMTAFDQWVVERVIQHSDLPKLTLQEIKVSARGQFVKADVKSSWTQGEWIISAMYLLEKMGWVARIDDGSEERQGHAEWLINPHLQNTFKSYRENVVQAKLERDQERLDIAQITYLRPAIHGMEILESN